MTGLWSNRVAIAAITMPSEPHTTETSNFAAAVWREKPPSIAITTRRCKLLESGAVIGAGLLIPAPCVNHIRKPLGIPNDLVCVKSALAAQSNLL